MPSLPSCAHAVACALLGSAVLLLPAAADARGPAITLRALGPDAGRGYFVYAARPGQIVHGRLVVGNAGPRPARVRLYAVDAATGPTTGASYLDATAPRRAVGAWTRVSPAAIRLAPGERRFVSFSLRVPRGVRRGDQLGGIVADPGVRAGRSTPRGESSFRIDVRTLTVVAVQLRLPGGGRPQMAIDSLRAGGIRDYQQLLIGLGNPGNVLVHGSGSVTVTTRDGRLLKYERFPVDTFVPRTRVSLGVFVRGRALPRGSYRGAVVVRFAGRMIRRTFLFDVTAADERQVFGSAPGSVAPPASGWLIWALLAGGALLVGVILGVAVRSRRQAARLRAKLREKELQELELWPVVPRDRSRHGPGTRR